LELCKVLSNHPLYSMMYLICLLEVIFLDLERRICLIADGKSPTINR